MIEVQELQLAIILESIRSNTIHSWVQVVIENNKYSSPVQSNLIILYEQQFKVKKKRAMNHILN